VRQLTGFTAKIAKLGYRIISCHRSEDRCHNAPVRQPRRYKALATPDNDQGEAILDVAAGQANNLTVKVVPKEK